MPANWRFLRILAQSQKNFKAIRKEITEKTAPDTPEGRAALQQRLEDVRKTMAGCRAAFQRGGVLTIDSLKDLKVLDGAIPQADTLDSMDKTTCTSLKKAIDALNEAQKGLCCVQMFHAIESFYLFRLLVKFRIDSDHEISEKSRMDASAALTGLLHNDPKMKWLSDWLRKKLVALDEALQNESPGHLMFFLKGGRALKALQGEADKGENDWDTQIVIDPTLPADAWYELFVEVHNIVLRALSACKSEFLALLHEHAADFANYVGEKEAAARQRAQPDAPGPAEDDDIELEAERPAEQANALDAAVEEETEDPSLKPQTANCKAELIDIGIPRRDTPEAFEQWGHLRKHIIRKTGDVPIPDHLYYILEYVLMIKEAFAGMSISIAKTPKRVVRLQEILAMPGLDAKLEEFKTRTASLKEATATAKNTLKQEDLLAVLLDQFLDAYSLTADEGLRDCFDEDFKNKSTTIDTVVKLPVPLANSLEEYRKGQNAKWDDNHDLLLKSIGFMHYISERMTKHAEDRAEFAMKMAQRKVLEAFVKGIYEGTFFQKAQDARETLEVQYAITGSFAARLHAEYADYPRMQSIEPVSCVDLRVYCPRDAQPNIVLELIEPLVTKYLAETTLVKFRKVVKPETGEIHLCWPEDVKIGDFTYKPLMIRISVVPRAGQWPQLSFIWGLPVLSLTELAWDYKKRCGAISEFGALRKLKTCAEALGDMLTCFENPDAAFLAPAVSQAAEQPQNRQPAQPPVEKLVANLAKLAQEKSNWCWAAVSTMMRRFYKNEQIAQSQVVQTALGNQDDMQWALTLGTLRPKGEEGFRLSWDQVKQQIDQARPFIFARSQHYYVAKGYRESGERRTILYWDPLPVNQGRDGEMSYDDYRTLARRTGATYYFPA